MSRTSRKEEWEVRLPTHKALATKVRGASPRLKCCLPYKSDLALTLVVTDGGFGGTEDRTGTGGDSEAAETRQQQDYGPGSGVGA